MSIEIRPEVGADADGIDLVNRLAFGGPEEARLVRLLRPIAEPQISLVAADGQRVAGHIFFSPVTIEPLGGGAAGSGASGPSGGGPSGGGPSGGGPSGGGSSGGGPSGGGAPAPRGAIALGPMAVLPELQNRGIGSRLVEAGLEACRRLGEPVVFVVGHPAYYPRFGFRPATPLALYFREVADQPAFMVLELEPGALAGRRGLVRYLPAFDEV